LFCRVPPPGPHDPANGTGLFAASAAPLVGAGLLVVGLAVLLFSWIRVNHRHDPYKDIQR